MYNKTEFLMRLGFLINFFANDDDKYGYNECHVDNTGYCEVVFYGYDSGTSLGFVSDQEGNIRIFEAKIDGQRLSYYDIEDLNKEIDWENSFTEICDKIESMKSNYDEPWWDFYYDDYAEDQD